MSRKKKNLPHLQFYVGDHERDCNVLDLRDEMAWLKIVFKMHLKGVSSFKISTNGLQKLWKCDTKGLQDTIQELDFNDICDIQVVQGGYIFTSRRRKKELGLSETRRKAVKNRWDKEKENSITSTEVYKIDTNSVQMPDNDIDIDNDIDNDIERVYTRRPQQKGVMPGTGYDNVAEHEVTDVFEYFVNATGRKFSIKTASNLWGIRRWLAQYPPDALKAVCDLKVHEWKGDPKMHKFLRPGTVYGDKFEDYLLEVEELIKGTVKKESTNEQKLNALKQYIDS